jgi:cell division protein FtsB
MVTGGEYNAPPVFIMYYKPMNRSTAKSRSRLPGKTGRLMWIVFGVLIIWLFFTGPRSVFKLISATMERAEREEEIRKLEQDKAILDSLSKTLQDPYEIEKKAREEYNMKKKGERVFKIQGKSE